MFYEVLNNISSIILLQFVGGFDFFVQKCHHKKILNGWVVGFYVKKNQIPTFILNN